jgi:hypothetical protein
MPFLEFFCVFDDLVGSSNLSSTGFGIGVAKEEVGSERDFVSEPSSQQVAHRNTKFLAHEVEASKLERRVQLSAVVVERGSWIADFESECLELERVVPNQIRFQPVEGQFSAFAATAHFSETHITVVCFDFNDRADEPAPMSAGRVLKRGLERYGDSRRPDIGDFQLRLPSAVFSQVVTGSLPI